MDKKELPPFKAFTTYEKMVEDISRSSTPLEERPTSLKTFQYTYKVVWMDRRCNPDKYGYVDFDNQELWIDETLFPIKMAETFLHEIIHIINNYFDIVDDSVEEGSVLVQARGLTMIWKDNPQVLEWWTNLLK